MRGGDGGDGIPLLFSVKWSIIAVSIDVIIIVYGVPPLCHFAPIYFF